MYVKAIIITDTLWCDTEENALMLSLLLSSETMYDLSLKDSILHSRLI